MHSPKSALMLSAIVLWLAACSQPVQQASTVSGDVEQASKPESDTLVASGPRWRLDRLASASDGSCLLLMTVGHQNDDVRQIAVLDRWCTQHETRHLHLMVTGGTDIMLADRAMRLLIDDHAVLARPYGKPPLTKSDAGDGQSRGYLVPPAQVDRLARAQTISLRIRTSRGLRAVSLDDDQVDGLHQFMAGVMQRVGGGGTGD